MKLERRGFLDLQSTKNEKLNPNKGRGMRATLNLGEKLNNMGL
jgi:hypothetical protein